MSDDNQIERRKFGFSATHVSRSGVRRLVELPALHSGSGGGTDPPPVRRQLVEWAQRRDKAGMWPGMATRPLPPLRPTDVDVPANARAARGHLLTEQDRQPDPAHPAGPFGELAVWANAVVWHWFAISDTPMECRFGWSLAAEPSGYVPLARPLGDRWHRLLAESYVAGGMAGQADQTQAVVGRFERAFEAWLGASDFKLTNPQSVPHLIRLADRRAELVRLGWVTCPGEGLHPPVPTPPTRQRSAGRGPVDADTFDRALSDSVRAGYGVLDRVNEAGPGDPPRWMDVTGASCLVVAGDHPTLCPDAEPKLTRFTPPAVVQVAERLGLPAGLTVTTRPPSKPGSRAKPTPRPPADHLPAALNRPRPRSCPCGGSTAG